ncbi:MAG: response regulator transcription factor, partial [Bdellovibrionaceae bacterium]|nr:response regulator transcription factor [Pseudobdellovibrionaceae bacterium]
IKPLKLAEIKSKLKAIGRRSASYQEYAGTIKYKNLTLDLQNEEVSTANDERIDLTKTEFKIFHLLLQAKGSVVVREQMARKALTVRNHNVRTIDVHINALRCKLGDHGRKIRTLRGRGYVLTD